MNDKPGQCCLLMMMFSNVCVAVILVILVVVRADILSSAVKYSGLHATSDEINVTVKS